MPVSTFADLEISPREYSWPPYLPKAGLLCIAGRGGIGKTTTAIAICAWASSGNWPDGSTTDPIRSLILEFQDSDGNDIKPALIANNFCVDNVLRITYKRAADFDALESTIIANNIGIVLISPGRRYVMRYTQNENNDAEVEAILDGLHEMGKRLGCLIILIKHLNKKGDLGALERIANASAYVNSPRTVLFMVEGLLQSKKNKESLPLLKRFELVDVGEGAGPKNLTAFVRVVLSDTEEGEDVDAVLNAERTHAPRQERKPSASDWLLQYLSEHGVTDRDQIMRDAVAAGHSEDAVRKAKERNPLILGNRGGWQGKSYWRLDMPGHRGD
ncbi:MAG: AAA family ATPase [Nitrospira sp.]